MVPRDNWKELPGTSNKCFTALRQTRQVNSFCLLQWDIYQCCAAMCQRFCVTREFSSHYRSVFRQNSATKCSCDYMENQTSKEEESACGEHTGLYRICSLTTFSIPFQPNWYEQWYCLYNHFSQDNASWTGNSNPFTPKSDQFKISRAASPEISHHTVWRTWLFTAYSDDRWL